MSHTSIFQKYKEIFHIKDDAIDSWFSNGKNSIRVRLKDHTEFIFTFSSEKHWKLETRDSFINGMKK